MIHRKTTPGELVLVLEERKGYILETEKYREKIREKPREKTRKKNREIVLKLIRKRPEITTAGLAEETGLTPNWIEWQISQLKKSGLLERVGPDKCGHWRIKES
nr:winged helix-turn-helix transcriptional regulator [uncultured Desulfobacter sp.]